MGVAITILVGVAFVIASIILSCNRLDVVHRYDSCAVAKATDDPLRVDLLLDKQEVPLGETEFIIIITDVGVESFHLPGQGDV